ncbi:MAG: hypothetical protein JWQ62_1561 [Lacunisphaera sp.]|nr:hypothetical protein [Lacunisphaera sp.]
MPVDNREPKPTMTSPHSINRSARAPGLRALLIFLTALPLLVAAENPSGHPANFPRSSLPAQKIPQAGQSAASIPSPDYDQWDQERPPGERGAADNPRFRRNSHYASEVIPGTLARTVAGQTLVSRPLQPWEGGISLISYFEEPTGGLALNLRF